MIPASKTYILLLLFALPHFLLFDNNGPITETMVKEAEHERYAAITEKDIPALAHILADEFVYHQPTGEIASKSEYLENTKAGNPSVLSADFSDLNVMVYDDFAVSRGIVAIEARLNGNEITAELLFLNVWIFRDGRLQLAARQSAFQ
jgi:hypothetical protein